MPPVTTPGSIADLGGGGLSGVDPDVATLSLPASTTISPFGQTLVDDATAAAARATLGVVDLTPDDPTELDISNGVFTILPTIARQTSITTLETYLPVFSRKTADQDFTTTSPVAIGTGSSASPALALTLAASRTYELIGQFGWDGPNGSNDLTVSVVLPSGATVAWTLWGPATGSTSMSGANSFDVRYRTGTSGPAFGGAGAGTNGSLRFQGIIITTDAGDFSFTANHTAGPDATPFSILAGSYISARRVA